MIELLLDQHDNYVFVVLYTQTLWLMLTMIASSFIFLLFRWKKKPLTRRHYVMLILLAWSGALFSDLARIWSKTALENPTMRDAGILFFDGAIGAVLLMAALLMIFLFPPKFRKYVHAAMLAFLCLFVPVHIYMYNTHYIPCCAPPHGPKLVHPQTCQKCWWPEHRYSD